MKMIAKIIIALAFLLGILTDTLPEKTAIQPFVAIAFLLLLIGIYMLIFENAKNEEY